MKKRYRIVSKFRFTVFLVIMTLCLTATIGTLLGFNTASSEAMEQYNIVEIESGDTLWHIASEHAVSGMDVRKIVHDICEVNEITADQLTAGTKIIVPVYQ